MVRPALVALLLAATSARAEPAAPVDTIQLDFDEISVLELVRWAGEVYEVDFVLTDVEALKAKTVTVLSHRPMPLAQGWDVVVQALRDSGYAVVFVGDLARLVPVAEVSGAPLPVIVVGG